MLFNLVELGFREREEGGYGLPNLIEVFESIGCGRHPVEGAPGFQGVGVGSGDEFASELGQFSSWVSAGVTAEAGEGFGSSLNRIEGVVKVVSHGKSPG